MKKKILFVINTLGHAGAEMALIDMLKRIDYSKYEISLYVMVGQGELVYRVSENTIILNHKYSNKSVLSRSGKLLLYKTVLVSCLRNFSLLKNIFYIYSCWIEMLNNHKIVYDKLIWRIISDGAEKNNTIYDLAVAYIEGASTYYVSDHIKAKTKVAFLHTNYQEAGYSRKLDKNCYLNYKKVFTVSEEVKSKFTEIYPECSSRTEVFNNYLDKIKIINDSKNSINFFHDFSGLKLLTVGRLTQVKAYDIAIDTMEILKKRGVVARWYVLGEGNLRKSLERKIKEKELTNEFILLGAVSNPYPYFVQTDIYVHATRFEGKSIAIQEAQILGCAVIASDTSGNREQIIHNEDGLLCDLEPLKIADTIEQLNLDIGLRERLGQASKLKFGVMKDDLCKLLDMI